MSNLIIFFFKYDGLKKDQQWKNDYVDMGILRI